jgi:ribosomal RNA assembly protein
MADERDEDNAVDEAEQPKGPKAKKYRRDKPWDHDGIDHWKQEVRLPAAG